MSWPTFWVEETGDVELRLRRYCLDKERAGPCLREGGFHHASSAPVGRRPGVFTDGTLGIASRRGYARTHPAWPKRCDACEYAFVAADPWQIDQDRIYRRPETDETWAQPRLPVGAMFDCAWVPDAWRGSDGIGLTVVLPPAEEGRYRHLWHVDGPASSHPAPAWTRTGDPKAVPPTVDVNPSIATSQYHGHLHGGVLTDDLEGRQL